MHHHIVVNGMNGMFRGFINGVPFSFDDSDMDDYEVCNCYSL